MTVINNVWFLLHKKSNLPFILLLKRYSQKHISIFGRHLVLYIYNLSKSIPMKLQSMWISAPVSPQETPLCCGVPAAPTSSNRWPIASSRTWPARASVPAWCVFPLTWCWGPVLTAAGYSRRYSSAKPSSFSTSSSALPPCSVSAPSPWTGQPRKYTFVLFRMKTGSFVKELI